MDTGFTDRSIQPRRDLVPNAPWSQFDRQVDRFGNPGGGGGGGSPTVEPFDVSFDTPMSGTVNASFSPGTVNGLLPSNYNTPININVTGTYYAVISLTASGGQITGAVLSLPTAAPAAIPVNMGQPPLSFDFLIGIIVDSVWYRTIGSGSLTAAGKEVFRTSKTSPAPGTLPYDIWYSWLMGNA